MPPNRMMHERLRAELENLLAHVDLSPTRRKETSDPDPCHMAVVGIGTGPTGLLGQN